MTDPDVLDLREIGRTQVALAGGKGANLGELSRIEGVTVPAGFCVTTNAFRRIMAAVPGFDDQLARLNRLDPDGRDLIRALSERIRSAIEAVPTPGDLAAAITGALAELGADTPCAVRSSATAEDLPTASFAGQQDTYLNVTGAGAILAHISRCWASLFTERAVSYRQRAGLDHRKVQMAVVVQRMVDAEAAGVMFTADPVTSNRRVVAVEATAGLGEDLVSGLVNPDRYQARGGEVIAAAVAGDQPVLSEALVLRLERLGRRIEAHFGQPQDIEWCLAAGEFQIAQSRPITTLFPIPDAGDQENHVYVSVGHQQMMTDPMKPLGLSVWQLTTPRPMAEAGSRLFVDVTRALGSAVSRSAVLAALGASDPLIGDALAAIVSRGDFIPAFPDDAPGPMPPGSGAAPIEADPAVVADLIGGFDASLAALRHDIAGRSGPDLVEFILADFTELRRVLSEPRSMRVIVAVIEATRWLNERLEAWLGEKNAADALTRSAPGNVTSEMGLALLDVADVIRPHPEAVAFLAGQPGDDFLEKLPSVPGGQQARDAIAAYLERYGVRCAGEIDITRPRWGERPGPLVPMILGNIANFGPGEGQRRFEQGRAEAERKEREILARLRALPDGEDKASQARAMIERVRVFAGYREYPKYHMISRYLVYKQALLAEADRLVAAGLLREPADIFYLRLPELPGVLRENRVDDDLIGERKAAFLSHRALTPPRVLTSDGEAVAGSYQRADLPAGALAGLAVSAGTAEGRARVITDLALADVEPGDILVTSFTDPSWTPLFVAVTALVTEVGGLMTHGAVIAREYGLPAVVGVEGATRLIRDGQRIRVHGTEGYVEILS